jgi:hypothetical protein
LETPRHLRLLDSGKAGQKSVPNRLQEAAVLRQRSLVVGLGISIVPLLPSGAVTRGRRVEARALDLAIRPIHSGILLRRSDKLSSGAARLFDFTKSHFSH